MTVHTSPLLTLVGRPTLESVLAAALRTGGDFAEIFVEDRVNSSALLSPIAVSLDASAFAISDTTRPSDASTRRAAGGISCVW